MIKACFRDDKKSQYWEIAYECIIADLRSSDFSVYYSIDYIYINLKRYVKRRQPYQFHISSCNYFIHMTCLTNHDSQFIEIVKIIDESFLLGLNNL